MSIKREIMEAINLDEATVQLNSISYIQRWRKDYKGSDVDCMEIRFKYVVGIKGGKTYLITARDYDGIVSEINQYTAEYLSECAETAAKNLQAGYR